MSSVRFSPQRVTLIAWNTLLEAMRHKLVGFLVFLSLALVLGARWFRDFNFGAPELKFLADLGFGAMAFFGAAMVVTAMAQLFLGEIETGTASTLLAKPVWRAEFVLGKFLGVVALAGLFCALLTGLLLAVLFVREGELMAQFADAFPHGRTVAYANVVMAGFLQWLKLAVLGSLVLLIASFANSQLFTVAMGGFVLVICHLQHLAAGAYARGGSWAGRVVGAGLSWVFPNFQLFHLADSLVATEAPGWWDFARVAVYGLAYVVAACSLAIFSFRQREI